MFYYGLSLIYFTKLMFVNNYLNIRINEVIVFVHALFCNPTFYYRSFSETGNNSYGIDFVFRISNVNIHVNTDQMNETYNTIQNKMNSLVSKKYFSFLLTNLKKSHF